MAGTKPLADCPNGLLGAVSRRNDRGGRRKDPARRRPRAVVRLPRTLPLRPGPRSDQDQGWRAGGRSGSNTDTVVSAGFGLWLDYNWPSTAGKPTRSRATISRPSVLSRACERPSSNATNTCGSMPRNRAGGRTSGKAIDLPPAYIEAVPPSVPASVAGRNKPSEGQIDWSRATRWRFSKSPGHTCRPSGRGLRFPGPGSTPRPCLAARVFFRRSGFPPIGIAGSGPATACRPDRSVPPPG